MNKYTLSSVALAASLVCAAPVQADPLALKLSETVTYDSNYARNETNQKEVISTTGAGLTLDKNYGRQNYFLSGRVDYNKHKNFEQQDNTSYDIDGRFVSEIASNWAVSVNGSSSLHLNSIENNQLNQRVVKNEVSQHDAGLNVQYGVAGRWSLLGSLGYAKTSYSLDSYRYQNRDQNSGGLRLVYNTSDLLNFGVGVSAANSEYPNQYVAGVPEEVKQRSLDFSTNYQVTGSSRLAAIVSYAQNKYRSDAVAEFKGVTGRLNWEYKPGGATTYGLGIARVTNNDGSGTGLRNNLGALQEQTGREINTLLQSVTNSIDANVRWSPTAKLGFGASVSWDQYEVSRRVTGLDQDYGKSKSSYLVFGLSSNYQFARSLSLGCNVQRYKQTAETNPSASSGIPRIDFDGNQVACTASFTID